MRSCALLRRGSTPSGMLHPPKSVPDIRNFTTSARPPPHRQRASPRISRQILTPPSHACARPTHGPPTPVPQRATAGERSWHAVMSAKGRAISVRPFAPRYPEEGARGTGGHREGLRPSGEMGSAEAGGPITGRGLAASSRDSLTPTARLSAGAGRRPGLTVLAPRSSSPTVESTVVAFAETRWVHRGGAKTW